MPEEGFETQELKDNLDEAREHAEEHAHGEGHTHGAEHAKAGTSWITWLSLSTAVLAVVAAIASLESGSHANEAIVLKTDATLVQSAADDAWGDYQAKSIKEDMFHAFVALAPSPEQAKRWDEKSAEEKKKKGERELEARKLGEEVKASNTESEHHMHLHHVFAKSVTIFQVAIAIAAIAALTKRKRLWLGGLAIGAVGCVFLLQGFFAL